MLIEDGGAVIEEGAAAPTLTMHWNQWLKVSFSVSLPNGDPSSGGIILPKHHNMFPVVDVNCNIDFKHEGDSSEPVESCRNGSERKIVYTTSRRTFHPCGCHRDGRKVFLQSFGNLVVLSCAAA